MCHNFQTHASIVPVNWKVLSFKCAGGGHIVVHVFGMDKT